MYFILRLKSNQKHLVGMIMKRSSKILCIDFLEVCVLSGHSECFLP